MEPSVRRISGQGHPSPFGDLTADEASETLNKNKEHANLLMDVDDGMLMKQIFDRNPELKNDRFLRPEHTQKGS